MVSRAGGSVELDILLAEIECVSNGNVVPPNKIQNYLRKSVPWLPDDSVGSGGKGSSQVVYEG